MSFCIFLHLHTSTYIYIHVQVQGRFRGVQGKVVGHHGGPGKKEERAVDVEFTVLPPEPAFGYILNASVQEEYFSSQEVCRALRISGNVLGKIVGAVFVDHPMRYDVGLNLRRQGQYSLLGYAKREEQEEDTPEENTEDSVWQRANAVEVIGTENSVNGEDKLEEKTRDYWQYSAKTVNLILEYRAAFPALFKNLERLEHAKKYTPKELLGPEGDKQITDLADWHKAQPVTRMARTPLTTQCLSKEAVRAIERAGDVRTAYLAASEKKIVRVNQVPVEALYRGDTHVPTDVPLAMNTTAPRLGDRVVNLNATGIPFGQRGTVVAVHSSTGYVEVLYDDEFVGGRPLQGTASQFRGRLCPWSGLLCVKKAESSPQAAAQQQQTQTKIKTKTKAADKPKPAASGGKKEINKDASANANNGNNSNNGNNKKHEPVKSTNLLKQKLNIGGASTPTPPASTPTAAEVVMPPPAPSAEAEVEIEEVTLKFEKIEIVQSDGSGRAALLAAAGEMFDALVDLPTEPELAGVIQYMPIGRSAAKGATDVVPAAKPKPAPKKAPAPKKTPNQNVDAAAALKAKLKVGAGGNKGKGKEQQTEKDSNNTASSESGVKEGSNARADEANAGTGEKKKSATQILREHMKLKNKDKEKDKDKGPAITVENNNSEGDVTNSKTNSAAKRTPAPKAKTEENNKDKEPIKKVVKPIKPLVPSSILKRKL